MTNKLINGLKNESNLTETENGAVTYKSSLSGLLDFFAMGGAIRTRSEQEKIDLFKKALFENEELALKCLFYFRDIRGGQGERQTFRTLIKWLAQYHSAYLKDSFRYIPEYGRWDDLFVLRGTELEMDMVEYIRFQLSMDMYTETPSLLAKWMPSVNTSSKETRELAKWFIKHLRINHESHYRKSLSALRSKIKVLEQKLCSNQWSKIDYEHVPSQAGKLYRKAFSKHDAERYVQYLADVKAGRKEIKTSTLYPYQLVKEYRGKWISEPDETIEQLWSHLPNYCVGEEKAIVVADTSGSMEGDPISVSLSLAIYFAERNKGPFKDKFITFSQKPTFHNLKGNNLYDKLLNLDASGWDQNTNLQAVFDLVLSTGLKYKVPQVDMPTKIYIVSDMEFDVANGYSIISIQKSTNLERIIKEYAAANYKMPTLVFWNVNARNNQSPITVNDTGVFLVSGLSPSIFKNLMQSKSMNAIDLMLEVLNSERYSKIKF